MKKFAILITRDHNGTHYIYDQKDVSIIDTKDEIIINKVSKILNVTTSKVSVYQFTITSNDQTFYMVNITCASCLQNNHDKQWKTISVVLRSLPSGTKKKALLKVLQFLGSMHKEKLEAIEIKSPPPPKKLS